MLAAGAAFTLGVFLTYLGVGVGVLRFLAALPFLSAVSRWVYGVTAVLCLFLAAGSLHDWWQARQGKVDEMRLKLPTRLRRWINRAVREGAGMRAFVPDTFVTGAVTRSSSWPAPARPTCRPYSSCWVCRNCDCRPGCTCCSTT